LNPTKAVSRINVAILGVFLDPVYQRMQNSTDHAIQNHVCWQGGIFTAGALESLSSLTGQQMKKRVQAASVSQGCQICFFDAKFHKFDFFGDTWRQKVVCFFVNICFFWRQLAHAIRLVSSLLKSLANSITGFFRQCMVYFLKRCLAAHRRIKLSHIWQPIVPKVRVESEECYNFILLKCPTINKEF